MIARRKFRTKEARKRARIQLAVKIGVAVLLCVLLAGGLFYVSNLESLRLREIHIEATGVTHKDSIASVIDSTFSGSFLGVLPHDSIAVPHKTTISENITNAFPRIKSVHVDRLGLYTLHVDVEERSAVALWCGDVVPPLANMYDGTDKTVHTKGTCYVMDKTGYIFAKAPTFNASVYPRYYGSLNKAEPVAQYFIDTERFTEWQAFYNSVTYDDITPVALLFANSNDAELYLSNGMKILIPRQQNLQNTHHRLSSLLAGDTIEEDRSVQYIDLRFGNKAFIKYTEEE